MSIFPKLHSPRFSCGLKNLLATVVFVLLMNPFVWADTQKVMVTGNGRANTNEPYYFYTHLLELAFEKTRTSDGVVEIVYNDHGGGIERDRAMLASGTGIDVMWASVTQEREQKLRAINVDLLKGLNNYRVLLIRRSDIAKFDGVKTLDDLKKFTVGTGTHWTDGIIMKNNGFPMIYTSSYVGLFKMLGAGRFDFISRGLHEIGFDLELYANYDFVEYKRFLLKYDTPIRYSFFVNKSNVKLAERIERGLRIAQSDGSYDKLFAQIPSFKQGEDMFLHSNYIVFEIKNNTSGDASSVAP